MKWLWMAWHHGCFQKHKNQVRWGGSIRWLFCPNSVWSGIESTTIWKAHTTLKQFLRSFHLIDKTNCIVIIGGYAIGVINTNESLRHDEYAWNVFTHKFRINNKISMAALSKRYWNGFSWNVLRNKLSAIFCLQVQWKTIFATESETKLIRHVKVEI